MRRQFFALYLVIAAIDVALVAGSGAIGNVFRWPAGLLNEQLNLTHGANLAAWYGTLQLVLLAGAALAIGCWTLVPYGTSARIHKLSWISLAVVIMIATVYENPHLRTLISGRFQGLAGLGDRLGERMGIENAQSLFGVIGLVLGFAGLWLIFVAFRCLSLTRASKFLAMAGLTCWVVALGCGFLRGRAWADPSIVEMCELLGTTFLLFAFLEHLRHELQVFRQAEPIPTPMFDVT
ncbi:MAG: hypothetical protein L0Y42_10975 [Phycisphaerales bacterium]|nr:hypothetical protein [Phycisphaerales bacterium]